MSNVFGPKKPLFGPYTYRAKQNSNGDTLIAVYHGSKRIAHIDAYWAYSMRAIEEHEADEKQRGRGKRLVCASDLRALGAEGRYPNVLAVGHAFIDDEAYKGKGIGRAMYEAMMVEGFAVRQTRIGGQPGPMFFIPDECKGAGNTSAEAQRVWASLARDYPSQGTSIRVDAPPVIGSRARANPRRRNPEQPLVSIVDAARYGDILRSRDGRTPVAWTRYGGALYLDDLPQGWSGKGTHKGLVTLAKYFNALPQEFPVYRGVPVPKGEAVRLSGTHWSLDRSVAENFARGEHEGASSWPDPEQDDAVLITSRASLGDVTWPETMRLFLRFSLSDTLALQRDLKKAEREVVLAMPPADATTTRLPLTNPRRRNPVALSPGPFGGTDLRTTSGDGHANVFVGTGKQTAQLLKAAYPKYPDAIKRIGKHKGKVAWLDYMEARETGKGAGSRVLAETLAALDAQGVEAVYLHAASGEEQDARVRFFGRHGFVSLPDDADRPRRLMVRLVPRTNPRRWNSANTREEDENVPDCAWCGAACDQPHPYPNRRGEAFCSPSHRSASNRALARFLGAHDGPSPRRRRNPGPTETPASSAAFRRWFGKSKVVDAAGEPLVVYHGSRATFDTFRRPDIAAILARGDATEAEMNQGMGIYFTDSAENAATYGYEVYPVYLRMLKPLIVDAQGEEWSYVPFKGSFYYADDIVSLAEEKGHDGVIFLNIYDTHSGNNILSNTYIVFDPKQIKSATKNAGTFDPDDANIYRNPRPRSRR